MYKLGQFVSWTSQASGTEKTKVGIVACVVPPNVSIADLAYTQLAKRSGGARSEVSYIVISEGKEYWPVVSKLSIAPKSVYSGTATTNVPPVASKPKTKAKPKQEPIPKVRARTLVGFSLDFSGSMSHIKNDACNDYNESLKALSEESIKNKQDTYITTIKCGVDLNVNEFMYKDVHTTNIKLMRPSEYRTEGNTPLWDSIDELIDNLEVSKKPDDAVLVMVITDGEENGSRRASSMSIANRIRNLQATDRWSFTFRVPHGYKNNLIRLGISSNNIIEWEQTSAGFSKATTANASAIGGYMSMRSTGATSTQSFYANLNASDRTIKGTLKDISGDLRILPVGKDTPIRDFVHFHGENFSKGGAFYQLTKTEDIVQDYKEILVQDKRDGKIYGGRDSRDLLKLPHAGNIKLKPGNTGFYDVFIQSTSVNRKLLAGTKCLYKSN